MKIKLTLIILLSTYLISCRTVKLKHLRTEYPIEKKLPMLEPRIEMNSLLSAYSLGSSSTTGYGSSYGWGNRSGGFSSIGSFSSESLNKEDKRIRETITLFEREVKDNISTGIGKSIGYIDCTIEAADTRATGWLLIVPSILSLYSLNLIGVPFFFYKTELEIEVVIRDKKDNPIARYKGYGKKNVPVAMYYGYYGHLTGNKKSTDTGAARISAIQAFKVAMKQVKKAIEKDYEDIVIELKK
jgi:hypothetical protein